MTGPVIKASDRVLVIGFTGSGKTVWIQAHASRIKGQLLVIDIKGDINLRVEHANCYTVKEVRRELKRSRVIRFKPADPFDQAMMQELFGLVFETPNLRWWLDESIGPTGPNVAAPNLIRVLVQGRSRGLGGFAAAQRPVGFTPYLRNQADHVVIFAQRWSTADLSNLSTELGYDRPAQLRDQLMSLNRQYGDLGRYAHIHFERATGKLWARPPMPEWMLRL
jgi:DNA helicase HerA-like ATPase